MKVFLSVSLSLFVLSCANQQPESSQDNLVSNPIDTIPAENTEVFLEDSEYEDFDFKVVAKSKFKKNQIQEGIFYIYNPNGTTLETTNGIGELNAGSKVVVTTEFDKIVLDETTGAVGYLNQITDADGETGTLSSASLVSLPYPSRKYTSLEEYALNQLHQIDSIRYVGSRHKTNPDGGHEGEYEQIDYLFENGIKLTTSNGYEAATEFMSIPGITVQQGFYFLSALGIIDLFEIFDGKIPNKEMENAKFKNGDEYIDVGVKTNSDGSIAYLSIGPVDGGCGCWYSITNQGDFIQIEVGCGC